MAKSSTTIEIIRGDDISLNLTFSDTNGDAINITGYTIFFTAKRRLTDADADALIAAQTSSHISPAAGQTVIELSSTDTAAVPEGSYHYDLQLKDADGNISSTKRGVFNVVDDVTKRTT